MKVAMMTLMEKYNPSHLRGGYAIDPSKPGMFAECQSICLHKVSGKLTTATKRCTLEIATYWNTQYSNLMELRDAREVQWEIANSLMGLCDVPRLSASPTGYQELSKPMRNGRNRRGAETHNELWRLRITRKCKFYCHIYHYKIIFCTTL